MYACLKVSIDKFIYLFLCTFIYGNKTVLLSSIVCGTTIAISIGPMTNCCFAFPNFALQFVNMHANNELQSGALHLSENKTPGITPGPALGLRTSSLHKLCLHQVLGCSVRGHGEKMCLEKDSNFNKTYKNFSFQSLCNYSVLELINKYIIWIKETYWINFSCATKSQLPTSDAETDSHWFGGLAHGPGLLGMLIRCLAGGVLDKWRQFKVQGRCECVWQLYDLRVQSSTEY